MLSVVILAGGLATRMRPLTDTIPKSMLEVNGHPFIHWQLKYLVQQGVRKVVLCIGHLGDMLCEYVGDGSNFGLTVMYSCDGYSQQGTGGAIKQALPMLEDAFFVLYGDSFLPIAYADILNHFQIGTTPSLMTVFKNDNQLDRSNVNFQAGYVLAYDKRNVQPDMKYIDYGLSVLSKDVFSLAPDTCFDLGDLYTLLAQRSMMAGYEVHERFYEVGSYAGLAETIAYFNSVSRRQL